MYEFQKSERDSLDQAEERAFKELAKLTLAFFDDELGQLIKAGTYKERRRCDRQTDHAAF